jgi:O-antigen/teichoic acid export membrane protein
MANGAYYLCSQWQIAQGSYVAFGRVRILQAALQMAIGGTVFVMAPAHGMVVAAIISQAAAAALAMRGAQLRPAQPWGRETIACMRTNAKAAFTNSASALLQYATPLAPVVAGSLFLAKADIGAYFLFSSAVAAPGAVLRRAILSYFNGEVKDAEQLRSLLAGMTARTGLLVLVGAGALGMLVLLHHFAGALTDLVFGPRWHHYSGLLLPLVVFFGLDTLLQPFSTFLGMWGRERSQVAIEVLRFSLTYLAWPLLVFAFGLQFEAAIVVFLVLMSAVYLLNCAVVLRAPPQSVGVPAP